MAHRDLCEPAEQLAAGAPDRVRPAGETAQQPPGVLVHAGAGGSAGAVPEALRWRVHWAVAELDARGEIDEHAAMCLRHAIRAGLARTVEMILVDLRDLTAIAPAGLALFIAHDADCHAHGMDLGLLLNGHDGDRQIAEAFVLAGLGDRLHYSYESRLPAGTPPSSVVKRATSARPGRHAGIAGPLTRRRPRRSATA